MDCADAAAEDGRRCSNVYEVNPWLWLFGRGKPRIGGLTIEETAEKQDAGKLHFFSPFWEKWEIPLFPAPTFPTFPTIPFPTFRAAIIKSITFPAHVFIMETCPFKERTQPWSQPCVERDLPSKKF